MYSRFTQKSLLLISVLFLFFSLVFFVEAQVTPPQTLGAAIPPPEEAPALTQEELQRWAAGAGATPRVDGLQSFQPLAGIPGLPTGADLGVLINAAYKLAIALGALIAVFQITLAGFKYLASPGNFTSSEEAKDDIKNSLLGLLILLSTVLILETIFGEVNLNPIASAPNVRTEGSALNPGGSLSSVDTTVKNELGCKQTGGDTGRTCSSGSEAVITGGKVQCANTEACDPNDPTLCGQRALPGETFKPVTKSMCESNGIGQSIIEKGGTLYGTHTITLGEMKAKFPGQNLTNTQVRQRYMDEVLKPACQGASGGNEQAAIAPMEGIRDNWTIFNREGSSFNFMCSTPQ